MCMLIKIHGLENVWNFNDQLSGCSTWKARVAQFADSNHRDRTVSSLKIPAQSNTDRSSPAQPHTNFVQMTSTNNLIHAIYLPCGTDKMFNISYGFHFEHFIICNCCTPMMFPSDACVCSAHNTSSHKLLAVAELLLIKFTQFELISVHAFGSWLIYDCIDGNFVVRSSSYDETHVIW